MQLSEAQMREAFEKEMGSYLAKLRGPHCMALSTKLSGEYAYLETEIAWRSWRAALLAQADARPVASARGLKVEAWLAQGLDGDLVRAEKLCRTEDEANDFMHTMTTVGHYKSVRKRPLVLGFGADSAATVAEPTTPMEVLRVTYAPDMTAEEFAHMWPKFKAWQKDEQAAQQQAEPESVIKRQAQKIGELIADRDSWIEAHARLYRLYHDQSPRAGEEIHVNVEGGDVYTLPLQLSGMDKPRFVVHVPCSPQAEPSKFAVSKEWLAKRLERADDADCAAGQSKPKRPCDTPPGCNATNCLSCGEQRAEPVGDEPELWTLIEQYADAVAEFNLCRYRDIDAEAAGAEVLRIQGELQPRCAVSQQAEPGADERAAVAEKCARFAELYRDEHACGREAEEACNEIARACREFAAQSGQRVAVPEAWREIVKELAVDLENELKARYQGYPENYRRRLRDMAVIERAVALLNEDTLAASPTQQEGSHG